MLQVHDIRETRVYQDAREEGRQEGRQEGRHEGIAAERERSREEKLALIAKLAARQMPAAEIADLLKLEIDVVLERLRNN